MKGKITSIISCIILAAAGFMMFKVATDTTYAVIKIDQQGNEYITDQYVSWDYCMAQPHYICLPMTEIEE